MRLSEKVKERKLSMRAKLTLSLSAIAVTLLISSIISILEYTRMSDYVSDLIADNIRSINVAQKLSEVSSSQRSSIAGEAGLWELLMALKPYSLSLRIL